TRRRAAYGFPGFWYPTQVLTEFKIIIHNTMKRVIPALIPAMLFIQCSRSTQAFKEELEALDSLEAMISETEQRIDSVNMEEVKRVREDVEGLMAYFSENYRDTNNRRFYVEDGNMMRRIK